MQFTTQKAKEVVIKARGKFISKAVDISEVANKRFLENQIEVKNIAINSEEFKNNEGKQVRVSTIEITLKRKWETNSIMRKHDLLFGNVRDL